MAPWYAGDLLSNGTAPRAKKMFGVLSYYAKWALFWTKNKPETLINILDRIEWSEKNNCLF